MGTFEIPLSKQTTASDLYEKVNEAHQFLIEKVWDDLVANRLVLTKQNELLATYWEGRKPEDGLLAESMTMKDADCLVRATTAPYPGAFFIAENRKVVVWSGYVQENKPNDSEITFKLKDGYLLPIKYEIFNNNNG
ncbi:Bifunctional polymyxin resistance protein ArnA [compost metagenome]